MAVTACLLSSNEAAGQKLSLLADEPNNAVVVAQPMTIMERGGANNRSNQEQGQLMEVAVRTLHPVCPLATGALMGSNNGASGADGSLNSSSSSSLGEQFASSQTSGPVSTGLAAASEHAGKKKGCKQTSCARHRRAAPGAVDLASGEDNFETDDDACDMYRPVNHGGLSQSRCHRGTRSSGSLELISDQLPYGREPAGDGDNQGNHECRYNGKEFWLNDEVKNLETEYGDEEWPLGRHQEVTELVQLRLPATSVKGNVEHKRRDKLARLGQMRSPSRLFRSTGDELNGRYQVAGSSGSACGNQLLDRVRPPVVRCTDIRCRQKETELRARMAPIHQEAGAIGSGDNHWLYANSSYSEIRSGSRVANDWSKQNDYSLEPSLKEIPSGSTNDVIRGDGDETGGDKLIVSDGHDNADQDGRVKRRDGCLGGGAGQAALARGNFATWLNGKEIKQNPDAGQML